MIDKIKINLCKIKHNWKEEIVMIPVVHEYNGLKTRHKIKFKTRTCSRCGKQQIKAHVFCGTNIDFKWKTILFIPNELVAKSTMESQLVIL